MRGYSLGMLARLFRLYALKRLFDMVRGGRGRGRGRTRGGRGRRRY